MKQAQRKSFDWYKMQQRFSIRKYHFGAASVLLGTALVLGTAVNTQAVQAEEHNPEATNSVSVDKIVETTKPAEVSTAKKETTYAAPTVVNPVEVTPAKSEAVKAAVENVEESKVEKEEISHQSAVDKSKLLTALSRAKKLEAKLYTEASAANLKASIQAGQSLLGKADATEAELSAAESSIQSAVIGLELRSNSDKGTVSETSVAKKADAEEAEEETKQAPTTNRSVLDSAVLPTSRTDIVEAFSAPKTTNEILKPGLSLSDAHQNPAIRKEDLDKGQSGFRASSNPANPIVSGSGNTVAFTDISQSGRSYSFRGYGNARGGHSIHYDVTTVRQGNRLNFTIQYSGPGEFVNNNFILDKGDGFGNPSNATVITPRLREQSKPISQGANFVSHSGYTMTSATETSMQQTIRFSLPINNPNGDLSVRLKPVTFNVDQGGGGAATSNDPYSNSNYYYRANPLYLDANPNGGSSNKVVTEDIDFQTVYLPTSKLPEGQTRLVREGEKGQRQITYKVHRFGNETILGLPISNSVTKEAKPRILQIGVAKELIDTVKPRVDQNKVGDTNNLTFYLDNDGNGVYTEGVDELVQKIAIKDGAKGEKGDQGQAGRDGVTPTVTVKDNKDDGTHTITINDGRGNVTSTVVRDGFDGASPLVATQRNDADKTTTVIFYYDQNDNNEFDAGDTKLKAVVIADGAKGEKGDKGATPKVTTARGADGHSTDITFTVPGEEPVTVNIKDGKDGRTPTIDLNALVEAVRRGVGSTSNSQPSGTSRSARNRRALPDEDRSATESSETVQPSTTGSTASQPTSTQPKPSGEYAGTEIKAYYDNNHNGVFDEGDELISSTVIPPAPKGENGNDGKDAIRGAELLSGIIAPRPEDGKDGDTYIDATTGDVYKKRDGAWGKIGNIRGPQGEQGPKGDKGENGKDGFTPEVTVTDNNNGTHTITITQPDNKPSLTTIVKNGADGQTPKVKAERDEAKKQTTLTFYIDKDGDGNYTEGTDTLVQTTVVKDGQDGAKGADGASGRDGKEVLNGKVDPKATDGKDGDSFVNTETGDVFVKKNNAWESAGNIKGPKGDKGENGRDGKSLITVKDGNETKVYQEDPANPGQPLNPEKPLAVIRDGADGKSPTVTAVRKDEANHKGVEITVDNHDGTQPTTVFVQDGASGRDGKEVLNGKVNPQATDGKDGDTFVNTETGDVFVKKGNTWEPAGNIKGPKGDKGEDGKTPEITTKSGADGKSTDVTITVPGKDPVTVNIKDGKDGKSLIAKKEGNETKIFVEDPANPGQPLDSTKPLATVLDGLKGDKGENGVDGKSPVVTVTDNGDGTHSITVRNGDGSESTTKVKDGKDGKTATITTTENPDGSHTITVTNPDGTSKETVVKNGKDGKTPKVEVTDNNDGTHTVKVTDGEGNITNAIIKDGKDGKAATATTTENQDGSHTVTITNPDGTKNEFVVKNGRDGVDGRTPTASVRDNGDGSHTIVITNPEGVTTETTVRDGKSPKVTITDEQNGTHKISVLNGDGTTTETIIKDGKSPVATVTDNHDGTYTIHVENGNGTVSETTVRDGKSPTAKVVDNGDGTHTITVVNSDGTTTTTTVRDGKEPKLEIIDNNNGSHTIKVTGANGKETTTTIFDGKSPKANIVDNGDGTHTLTIVDSDGREYKSIIKDGKDGKDGVSPTVTVKNNNDGTHVVTIINPDGSKTEMVIKDGKDGKSPKASVEDNGNGSHTITIINSDGTVTKTVVKDGKDGRDGRDGKDGKDGKCGCQDKPVTPSNDKPVPPTPNVLEGPTFAMPKPPVHELPELELPEMPTPPVNEIPEFNGGVPGMPEVNELPNPEIPGMPTPPAHEVPEFNGGVPGMPEVNDKPGSNIPEVPTSVVPTPEVPVQPTPAKPVTPVNNVPASENHGKQLPETGSQSDYISVLLGSGILLSLYVGRRKED